MAKTTGIIRSEVILRMKAAIKTGQSASAFIRDMREQDLGYRRQTMLADWRSVGNIQKKEGLLKYVRKDYLPSPGLYADVAWDLKREFFYKLKVQTRLRPGEPLTEKWINVTSDKPLTPGEWETEIKTKWSDIYRGVREELVSIEPILAMKKVV